jgi:hypothetical protein
LRRYIPSIAIRFSRAKLRTDSADFVLHPDLVARAYYTRSHFRST